MRSLVRCANCPLRDNEELLSIQLDWLVKVMVKIVIKNNHRIGLTKIMIYYSPFSLKYVQKSYTLEEIINKQNYQL